MSEEYKDRGDPLVKVNEECGEVVQAISKCLLWGYQSTHPSKPELCNARDILNELADLEYQIERLKPILIYQAIAFEDRT